MKWQVGAAQGSRPPVARIAHCRAPIPPVELTGLADWGAQLEERVITEVKAHKPGPTGMETLAHIKSMIEGWCAPPDQIAALVAGYPTHMQHVTRLNMLWPMMNELEPGKLLIPDAATPTPK